MPRLLRERRARPLHGPPLQPPRHSRRRGLGRQPSRRARGALRDLAHGRVRVVFSVDLFNEGVDVPAVDTVLMLRPTESPTLFLQQLGRGLRKISRQGVLHGARLRRHSSQGVPLRPPLPGAARWIPPRRRTSGRSSSSRSFPPAAIWSSTRRPSEIVLRSLREAIPTGGRRRSTSSDRCAASDPTSASPSSCTSPASTSTTSTTAARAGPISRRPPARPCSHAARTRRCSAERSDGCCTSTTGERIDTYRRHLAPPIAPGCRRFPNASDACCTCSSPPSPTVSSRRDTSAPGGGRTALGASAGSQPNCSSCSACSTAASTTCTRRSAHTPTARCRSMLGTAGSRSSPRSASVRRPRSPPGRAASTRPRRPTPSCSRSRSTRAAAASRRRPATATTPISRTPHPLGEPVRHPSRQPTGLRYRNHERDGAHDLVVHPTARRRPRILVPRPGHLSRPRRRAADGDHLGTRASALGRSLPVVRRGGGVTCRPFNISQFERNHPVRG